MEDEDEDRLGTEESGLGMSGEAVPRGGDLDLDWAWRGAARAVRRKRARRRMVLGMMASG